MNCTRNEFINKVHSKWPHKHISDDVLITGISSDIHTVYMLDTLGECQLTTASKFAIASHIWRDGAVLRDTDGLFSSMTTTVTGTQPVSVPLPVAHFPSFTYVPVYSNGAHWELYDTANPPYTTLKNLKCECGSSSVGSNKHSSYCPVKE